MFYTSAKSIKARTAHRCTYCGEVIAPGETYIGWENVGDDGWASNKMHPECHDDVTEGGTVGEFEYIPYANDRPRVTEPQDAKHE